MSEKVSAARAAAEREFRNLLHRVQHRQPIRLHAPVFCMRRGSLVFAIPMHALTLGTMYRLVMEIGSHRYAPALHDGYLMVPCTLDVNGITEFDRLVRLASEWASRTFDCEVIVERHRGDRGVRHACGLQHI